MNIKQFWRTIVLTIVFCMLLASSSAAKEPSDLYTGSQGHCFRSYDFQTTEILKGEIVSLKSFRSRRGFSGMHLMVKTDKETIEVHAAPSWFLAEQDFDLTSQDKITVIGSRINVDGQEAIIARQIIKGDTTLLLRDLDGFPVWRRS